MALAFPDGAPTQACQTLTPLHGNSLPFDVPAQLQFSTTTVNAGGMIYVSVVANSDDPVFGNFQFRGFMAQVRIEDGTGRVVGTFEPGPGVRHVDCSSFGSGATSTVTHTNHADKSILNMNWRAPTDVIGSPITVRFHYTIVMNVGLYWANEISVPVTVLNY